jgi:hypothetical protein
VRMLVRGSIIHAMRLSASRGGPPV